MHPIIALAQKSIQKYLETGHTIAVPAHLPAFMQEPRAVFVTLHTASGHLRGCRGTLTPTEPTLAEAVIKTAIASATDDPRFTPMSLREMAGLQIKVDVLSPMEPVTETDQLDEKVYGVVIQSGQRRAVLLPDISGVDSVPRQLELVRKKAGIRPDEPVTLYRFTVTRYHANSPE